MYIGNTARTATTPPAVGRSYDNSIERGDQQAPSKVHVKCHKDGRSASVEEHGRAIPVDMMAKYKKSAAEGDLHHDASGASSTAARLTRCRRPARRRAAVVNALSSWLVVVKRDGERHGSRSPRRGTTTRQAQEARRGRRGTGHVCSARDVFSTRAVRPRADAERLGPRATCTAGWS